MEATSSCRARMSETPVRTFSLFPRMLEPLIPSGGRVHLPVTSPNLIGLPPILRGSASRIVPQRDVMREVLRDRRYSLRSGRLVCSPPRSPLPLRRSSPRRAAVTFYAKLPYRRTRPRRSCISDELPLEHPYCAKNIGRSYVRNLYPTPAPNTIEA